MEQITKNQALEYFKKRQNKNILFNSFFNCNNLKIDILLNDVLNFGILKETLKIDLHSNFILLNNSRLDLKNNKYYLKNDALIIINEMDNNILIYTDATETSKKEKTKQQTADHVLITLLKSKIYNFNVNNSDFKEIETFLKNNNIDFNIKNFTDFKEIKINKI